VVGRASKGGAGKAGGLWNKSKLRSLAPPFHSGASSLLSGTGFIGFSDVASSSSSGGGGGGVGESGDGGTFRSFGGGGDAGLSSTSSASATPFYTGGDPDLQVICKRLSKKDGVTKHKALLELAQLVQARGTAGSSSSSVVEGLVPFWLYVYPRLVLLEDDRRVREAVFSTALPQLFSADRKAMVGVLGRHLLGPWWAAMSDPQKEVANAATRAFQTVFPKQAKRDEVLAQAAPVILGYLHDNLRLKPVDAVLDTSGGNGSSPEEAEERLERIVTCSLTALASLLMALDEQIRARLLNTATMTAAPPQSPLPRPSPTADSSSTPAAAAAALPAFLLIDGQSSSLEDVFRDSATWKFLSDTRPLVRRAAYGLLAAVAERADHVIRQTGQVGRVAQHVCGLLAEKETANFGNMWEAMLLFFHHFPKALTTTLDCKTQLFPRVLKLVRASFLGAAQASCPSLLPLVALVPPAAASASFYTDLLEALWKGAKADKNDGEEPYLVAIVEIATYLLVRQPAKKEEEEEKEGETKTTTEAELGVEEGVVLVGQLLTVLAKVLTREGGVMEGPASKALVTALAQLEKAGMEGKKGRKCLLLDVENEVWRGTRAVALRVLGLEASEEGGSTDGEAAVLSLIQDAKTSRQIQTRSARLWQLLTAAYEKGVGPTSSAAAEAEEEWGLEAALRFLFWQCVLHCDAHKDQHGDVLVPYLSLIEAVTLRLSFKRQASAAPLPAYASTSSFMLAFLIPLLQTTVQAASGASGAMGMLKPLVGISTTLNLELGEEGHWQELLGAVTPAQDGSGAGGLGVLLGALEAISATYERVRASVGAQQALPALNLLMSAAVAPYTLALIEDEKAGEAKEEHVRFLAVCLGAGGEGTTSVAMQRRRRTRQQPLLAPATVKHLVEHTLACQDEVGLEALVLALDKGDQECPVLDVVRSQAAAILTMAFQKLGPGGDVRIASVLSVGGGGEDEAGEEGGEEKKKQGGAQVGTPGFRAQVVSWLRSLLTRAVSPQQEQGWADDFVRLVEILSSASHEPASHFIPALLFEAGLADAALWAEARAQPQELAAMWRCLEAVMHELAEEELLHAASDAAMVLIRPGAPKEETVALIHEVLRAGVELGERASMTVPVPGRGAFALSRFLSATANEDVLPSDTPFQLFFPAGHDEEEEGDSGMAALPSVPWDVAHLLSQVVEAQLRVIAASSSWADAYLLARVMSLLEAAAGHEVGSQAHKPVNETAWSRVVLPKELTVFFDSSDELRLGTEVWYFHRRATPSSSSSSEAATPVPPESAWKRGKVVGVHRDDVEKYFTVSKASGGETQMEYSRLRRAKPSDIAGLVAGVCEGLPDLQFVDAIHHHRHQQLEGEATQHLESVARLLIAALTPHLEDNSNARFNVVLAWSAGEILRGLRALTSSPYSSPSLQAEIEEWMVNLRARWCALAEAALRGGAGKQDWSHMASSLLRGAAGKLDWPHVASSLYILAGLPPLDMAGASELWLAAVRVGVVTGTKRQQVSKPPSAGGEAAPVTYTVTPVHVSEAAQVAALWWAGGLSTACREQAACLEILEHLWDLQTLTSTRDAIPGTLLAALDLGLQTVLEKGSLALPPTTKVPLFRLALQGLTSPTPTATAPTTTSALTHEIRNRSRLLAVVLIPFDNRNLEWTTRIYAAKNPSSSAALALDLALWNADVDALLRILETDGQAASPGLHMSAFHVLRPYLRSAMDVNDDEDSDDEDDESKDGPTAAEEGDVVALMKGPRAKALANDAAERRDMARDLRIVARRVRPTFHRMLQSWVAPLADAGASSSSSSSHPPHPTQRLACLLEWEGVLEAVGGDGAAAEEDSVVEIEHLDAYRRGVFQSLLAWLLFLEHVEGVALSGPLRDAYSTYISILAALPLLLQACFRVLGRRVGSTADTTSGQYELQDLWATAHALGSGSHSAAAGAGGREMRRLVAYVLFRTIVTFPALVRKWWSSDCERWLSTGIFKFVEEQTSGRIVQREIDLLLAKGKGPDCPWGGGEDEIAVRGSAVTREVTAHYFKDDCTLEVLLRLPLAYPLRNVEVECTRSLGVSADKWNRWQLQIVTLLSMRDGSVVDAVALWVRNLQKEFEGMDPCPICMSIIEARNLSLPERECRTCHNKFHNSCILKWFATSGKNRCVLCQQATIG